MVGPWQPLGQAQAFSVICLEGQSSSLLLTCQDVMGELGNAELPLRKVRKAQG